MSSNPPSRCCIAGVKHEGEATGTIDKVGTQDAYIAYPPDKSTQNGIILFPDFMGYELTNMKLLADQFATNGYFTVTPDMWEGDNVPLNWKPGNDFNLGAWMGKHNPSKAEPIGEAVVKAMREDYGVKKLGGYVLSHLANTGGKGIDAGFIAHPTATTDDDVKAIDGPLSIAAAETDDLFPASKRHETEEILKDMKIPYQISLYSDVEHGFANKADLMNPRCKFATETAFLQAVNWFDEFIKKD
ncbi:hypothetical protein LTR37_012804 [Vermiconidia calcicola]|uniref:Uncharacterized protein n=1 Tax=Vermiconidia calcicola TaxID=1690605 RepID=A0ACC3MZQ9_9PEZI|nr:hypothetical protein LTR37_012804 [Vermiconidia calcicola]